MFKKVIVIKYFLETIEEHFDKNLRKTVETEYEPVDGTVGFTIVSGKDSEETIETVNYYLDDAILKLKEMLNKDLKSEQEIDKKKNIRNVSLR